MARNYAFLCALRNFVVVESNPEDERKDTAPAPPTPPLVVAVRSSCEMAAAVDLEDAFGAVFGEAKPEVHPTARPILFRAHSRSAAALRVVATDCHSLAWGCSLSVSDLDDLRDDVGIGGSWADFLDYLKSSLSSGEVKLLFAADQLRKSPGSDGAKLVATKAKGLPRITISLHSVTGAATIDAIAEFSLLLLIGLHGSLHPKLTLVLGINERMIQLSKMQLHWLCQILPLPLL